MRYIKKILFVTVIAYLSMGRITAQDKDSFFFHTIEKGQSIYSIANMYDIDEEDVLRLNPDAKEKIYAGRTLKIPQKKEQIEKQVYHTIQPGETLYRLTEIYNVPAKQITDENPGLSADNFKAGEVIKIPVSLQPETSVIEEIPVIQPPLVPRCKEMHKVKKKEDIFTISQEYGITEQELIDANPELRQGIKKNQLLCIPYPRPHIQEPKLPAFLPDPPTDTQLFRENQEIVRSISPIKAAIILPFTLEGELKNESARMLEFYEGFLIAVDSLKRKGISMELYVENSGSSNNSIRGILAKKEMKEMNIIFGPRYNEHVEPLADFANENNIPLVIPFTRVEDVFRNPTVFQVNTPHSYLYSEVYTNFTRQFSNANVIIMEMNDNDGKEDFINDLKQELDQHSISWQTVSYSDIYPAKLATLLSKDKENVFIPTSGKNTTFIPQLKLLKRETSDARITLFGYPEWQLLTDEMDSLFELDSYFYSSFYTNNLFEPAVNFTNLYHKWYGKDMINIYPKYGMLGFDVGYYFLSGLATYGTGFVDKLENMDVTPVQTGFKFERANNWGGFINKKVYFVHFTNNYELIKIDFDHSY